MVEEAAAAGFFESDNFPGKHPRYRFWPSRSYWRESRTFLKKYEKGGMKVPTPIKTTHELREEALHEAGVKLLKENDHNVHKSDAGNLIVDGKTIYNHEWEAIIHGKNEDILESVMEKMKPRIWP